MLLDVAVHDFRFEIRSAQVQKCKFRYSFVNSIRKQHERVSILSIQTFSFFKQFILNLLDKTVALLLP